MAIRFPSDAVSRSLRIQIWILTAVGDSVTDLPPFSRVTSGWLTSGYSQFASARTHPPHCRQEAAVPPRAVRGCPPRLPCRARAPSFRRAFHSKAMYARRDESARQTIKPNAVTPPMRAPCGSSCRNASDAPRPSQTTLPLPAVSWRTIRAISESTTVAKNDDSHAQTRPDCPSRCRLQTHQKDPGDTALTTLRCLRKITPHPLVV